MAVPLQAWCWRVTSLSADREGEGGGGGSGRKEERDRRKGGPGIEFWLLKLQSPPLATYLLQK